jgi:RNA polymerase sigma factor (TIGR02999 family)
MDPLSGEVTRLLVDLRTGNKDAESKLLVLLYDELRRIAASYLRRERPDHTLQPTALINEAYLRIVDLAQQNWENRAHFLGVCARIMRQILVDHARQRNAAKRGGKDRPLPLDDHSISSAHRSIEFVALDEALSRLEAFDSRQSRVVELRFFGGMSEEEISHILGISVRTIKRDWNVARAWLYSEMTK